MTQQNAAENTIDGVCNHPVRRMKNKRIFTHKIKKRVNISGTDKKGRGFRELQTHRASWMQEGQKIIASNLPNELVHMDGITGSGRDTKNKNITKNYKG